MHIGALFYLKRNFHFLHVKQQWKCPQKFTLSPTGGKDLLFAGNYLMLSTCLRSLGMIFFFFFLLVTWSCRALDLGFCAFWSIPLPRSEGGCCPAVLLSLPALCWRQSKMDKPSLLTFSYAIDCICLYEALCSPVESPDFPLASGKAWHIDFFHSLRLNAPSTRNSHETSSHRAWERKALCI